LQNRFLAQVKSSRSINRFLILHRRLPTFQKRDPRERAEQTDRANRELQAFREGVGQANKVERELQTLRDTVEHQTDKFRGELQQARSEIERLTLERDFYSKKASTLKEENRQLTEAATTYSEHAQKLERELTATATQYSLWGQKLERELNRIDPHGAPGRRFDAQRES
jgi:chromosome segregation ATPase